MEIEDVKLGSIWYFVYVDFIKDNKLYSATVEIIEGDGDIHEAKITNINTGSEDIDLNLSEKEENEIIKAALWKI